jgi:long-chain acyl-CoA synthetase
MITGMMSVGGKVGFYRGDVLLLLEDLAALKPTVFASVPRLLNRIYDKIKNTAMNSGSVIKSALFSKGLESKLHYLKCEKSVTHAFWDIILKKVKNLFGGRLRYIVTASAPISCEVKNFFRVVTGALVYEAYGQTESAGALSVTWPTDFDDRHVGSVVAK